MTTITEDYVSFEVAKLLKEKGFPQSTFRCHYIIDGNSHYKSFKNRCGFGNYDIIAPTLQIAMKWLREVYSLHIWIGHAAGKVLSWYYEIHGISDGEVKHISGVQCGSYEIACESAIKYCLENLI